MKIVKLTQVTCNNSKSILQFENHLSLEELKMKLSEKGFLESDFNPDDDDSDILYSYYTIDESEITEDLLDERGNIFTSESLKLEDINSNLIGHQEAYNFAKDIYERRRSDFKQMKKELGLTNENIAEIIELTPDSVKTMTQPNRYLPSWADAMIYVWKRLRK